MKRLRSGSLTSPVGSTGAMQHQQQQRVEERSGNDRVVVNSPYGSRRATYGWGNPFSPPLLATVAGYPNIHIGVSSLNAVPGKDRRMKTLLSQYSKKFNCLEHCYTYHNVTDEATWKSWGEMCPSLSPSSPGLQRGSVGTVVKQQSNDGRRNRTKISQNGLGKVDDGAVVDNNNDDEDADQKHPLFIYTIKANQYLTHTRMLAMDGDTEEHIINFFVRRCSLLGPHLGPVLLQLPPQFCKTPQNMERIEAVAARIPPSIRVAVEFRHCSWYNAETHDLLRRVGWALVVAHHHDDPAGSLHVDTGVGFMYVRLHGALGLHVGDYGPARVSMWAERIAEFVSGGAAGAEKREVFVFFNNSDSHVGGTTSSTVDATFLAERLRALLVKEEASCQTVDSTSISSSNCNCSCVADVTTISD
ncbi:hypothetical protein DQ04_04691000 [Trypanosoma grayi]|uniref:hypothetical protein n=1 Tax=Trypanosoma grayi TaxID=71804 RepID=UPI0004F4677C|nr:hypothetical protein DQ04_04691000 [Trypanosoma grayi]KEG09763.1 hypothetical protein DQ04_04691000 [Trypanosoma grayi]